MNNYYENRHVIHWRHLQQPSNEHNININLCSLIEYKFAIELLKERKLTKRARDWSTCIKVKYQRQSLRG